MNIEFKIGGKYNWRNQPERLVYMGSKRYPNGIWYQFALVESSDKVWSEVRGNELSSFEETLQEKFVSLSDTEILNFIESDSGKKLFNVGSKWYSRKEYMWPHKKHNSLREAVEYILGKK